MTPRQVLLLALIVLLCGTTAFVLGAILRGARDEARQTTCLSTVKMVALALQQYAADWDERLPPTGDLTGVQRRHVGRGSGTIERCPDDHTGQDCSYAMPAVWCGWGLGEVLQRSNSILVYEADHGVPTYRHREGMNIGYADEGARWRDAMTLTPTDIVRGLDVRAEEGRPEPWP